MTLNSTSNTQQCVLENIINLEPQSQPNQSLEATGQKYINKFSTNRSGDIGEYTIVPEAWKRGAEVYLNAGCDGKTDLILEIEGELYQINVKIAGYKFDSKAGRSDNFQRKWRWRADNASIVKPPIWCVVVEPRNDRYRVRWPSKQGRNQPPNCPPGLEKFWD